MKKKLIYIFIIVSAILVQTSVAPILGRPLAVADGVLMLVLAWSIRDGFRNFLGWAIFVGILYDLVAYEKVGTHALIFLLAIYSASFFSRRFSVELKSTGIFLLGFFVLIATFISRAALALGFVINNQTPMEFWKLFGSPGDIFLQLIYNSLFFIFWFFAIKKIKRYFEITV